MPENPSTPTGRQKDLEEALFGFGLLAVYLWDYLFIQLIRGGVEKYSFAIFFNIFMVLLFVSHTIYLFRAIADISPDPDKPDLVSLFIEIPGLTLLIVGAALQQIEPTITVGDRCFYFVFGAYVIFLLFKELRELMSLLR